MFFNRKIRNLKDEFPSISSETDDRIEKELRKELGYVPTNKKIIYYGKKKSLFIGLAIIMCASSAFAAVKFSGIIKTEKKGNYGLETQIISNERFEGNTGNEQNDDVKIYKISFTWNYIPEGMSLSDDGHNLKADASENTEGVTLLPVVLDGGSAKDVLKDKCVKNSEEININGHEGLYLEMDYEIGYNQRVYVVYPEYNRILMLYAGGIDKSEFIKVVEKLTITETDEVVDSGEYITWKSLTANFDLEEHDNEFNNDTGRFYDMTSIGVGEPVCINTMMKINGNQKYSEPVILKVSEVKVLDNISYLDESKIANEWKDRIDSEGVLIPATRQYVKLGEGVNTDNEVIKSDIVGQKLIYVTLEYTNCTENLYTDILLNITINSLEKTDKGYHFTKFGLPEDEWDEIMVNGKNVTAYNGYWDIENDDETMSENYIDSLTPGESKEVHVAFLVDEDSLENLYLAINGAETEIVDGAVYVDLGL